MYVVRTSEYLKQVIIKIARPDSWQNFMDTAKIIDLTRLCIQIKNTVVFSIIHTSNL